MAEQRVERRLAAVLAADVAGYSRLMGADEEGTLARSMFIVGNSSNRLSPNTTVASSNAPATDS
jgi:class 3 adenylate cyclase